MDAELLIRRRVAFATDDFAELVVWRVPEPVQPATHRFKYRLVFVVNGARVIGFDDERGKGDHRPDDGAESRYMFSGIDNLVAGFVDAVERWRRDHGRDRNPRRPWPT